MPLARYRDQGTVRKEALGPMPSCPSSAGRLTVSNWACHFDTPKSDTRIAARLRTSFSMVGTSIPYCTSKGSKPFSTRNGARSCQYRMR